MDARRLIPANPMNTANTANTARSMPRRALLRIAAATAAVGGLAAANTGSGRRAGQDARAAAAAAETYRAVYHFTAPDQWKNDPQRPVFIDGTYHYYYLHNADYLAGAEGTAWRLATTQDNVVFHDEGLAIPKETNANGDIWSGSAVVDTEDTAGFGAGAVVVIATQEPVPDAQRQAQYLWYSTDGGRSFTAHGTEPVLPNPGVRDFRDPKVVRDTDRSRWVLLLAENDKVGFYISENLTQWSYVSGFTQDGIGVLECPDLFRIRTAEGAGRWVLGVSANGKDAGLPNTYAYWTGDFDGESFHPDLTEPQWLDHGFDWYGAVTYEKHTDGAADPDVRYAIGWMNNWDYPDNTPTTGADGFNGTDSIVREVTLHRAPDGVFHLASQPVAALDRHVTNTVDLGDLRVDGQLDLSYQGVAYELTCEMFPVKFSVLKPGQVLAQAVGPI